MHKFTGLSLSSKGKINIGAIALRISKAIGVVLKPIRDVAELYHLANSHNISDTYYLSFAFYEMSSIIIINAVLLFKSSESTKR